MWNAVRRVATPLNWCRIPFNYGDICNDKDTLNDDKQQLYVESTRYDGLISSLQLFIIAIGTSSALQFLPYMSENFSTILANSVMIFFMVIGMVVMISIYKFKDNFLLKRSTTKQEERDKLTLIGIVVFYVLGSFLDFFKLANYLSCFNKWIQVCWGSYYIVSKFVHATLHAMRIVYFAGETVFCLAFNTSTFSNRSSTRHALMFLQAVNISIWFDALLEDTVHHHFKENGHSSKQKTDNSFCLQNWTYFNYSTETAECLKDNTTLYKFEHGFSPVFHPFVIEFTLLVGEFFIHCFLTCKSHNSTRKRNYVKTDQQKPIELKTTYDESEISNQKIKDKRKMGKRGRSRCRKSSSERTSLLEVVPTPSVIQSVGFRLMIAASITVNLLLIFFALLQTLPDNYTTAVAILRPEKTFNCYLCFFYAMMILAIAFGYHISRRFRVKRYQPFSGFDYLLLVTSSGTLVGNFFQIFAAVESVLDREDWFVCVIFTSLYIIETYLQVAFTLYSARIQVLVDTDHRSTAGFKSIILHLAMANATIWFIATFINKYRNPLSQNLATHVFGQTSWAIVNSIFTPMSLFFIFNSCLLLIKTFRRL